MKYQVQYVRIEHQMYLIEVEAGSREEAEEKVEDEFMGDEPYKVVHAEENVHDVIELGETA
jgi:hypothetical protein